MLIALFADIHANRQAFEACLAHAREQQVDRYAFLGDYVGYGADPEWVVEKVGEFVDQGAIAIVGNHDRAVSDPTLPMNRNAQIAIEWTRNQLGASARELLDRLPMLVRIGVPARRQCVVAPKGLQIGAYLAAGLPRSNTLSDVGNLVREQHGVLGVLCRICFLPVGRHLRLLGLRQFIGVHRRL